MRYNEFQIEEAKSAYQKLFFWSISVQAKTMSRITPFHLEELSVSFPILNAITANVRQIQLQGTGDCGQLISFLVDVALFAANQTESMDFVLNPTVLSLGHEDAELTLIDPEISVVGGV
ncbi:hypothetical protein [Terasakiella pusilla]|uniref:hypothetical protein n=1 Tax=Terasakiella pusilla TaxID=64973 RepID=UPI000491007D|nr:hypothetical protein [Terasakiella pusilla]